MTAHLIGATGIPGTGKSHFARSCRALGKTVIALTDPKEASFYGAEGTTLFADLDWRPHLQQFNASAWNALFNWLDARGKDDSKFVVLDTVSEGSDLAMHEVLKVHATGDPSDVAHGKAYTGHDAQIKTLVTELRRLAARDKTVVCTFHAQMRELEGAGTAAKRQSFGDKNKQEWQFDDQMLPVMCSSIRQLIHSAFDIWLYTNPIGFGPARKWYVTAQADSVRPAKHSVNFKAGVNIAQIGNTMQELFNSLDEPPRAAETSK